MVGGGGGGGVVFNNSNVDNSFRNRVSCVQKVGFSYGNSYYQPAVSGTDDILALASTTNCGRAGVWFFRIDEVETIDDNICESEGKLTAKQFPAIQFYFLVTQRQDHFNALYVTLSSCGAPSI